MKIRTIYKALIFIGFLLFSSTSFSQQIVAKASLDTAKITIGDHVTLTLELKAPRKSIVFPQWKDTIVAGVEIIEASKIDTVKISDSEIELIQKIKITAFEDSLYLIHPFSYIVGKDTVKTNPLVLKVLKPQLDKDHAKKIDTTKTNAIFDIKPPMSVSFTLGELISEYLEYIIALIVLIGGGLFIYYYLKKRRENKPLITFDKPKEPAHIVAIRQLEELKEKKLWQKGKQKDYYSVLTEIIRWYIEQRFQVSALELTSYEILTLIKNIQTINIESYEQLSQLLSTADMVKFAKGEPLSHENDLSMQNAFTFIEKTKPTEV